MRLYSWNVNGLRACLSKGFLDWFSGAQADILCLQETKMQEGQAEIQTPGYEQYWNSAEKKGYSGTAVFSRLSPLSVSRGMGRIEHDREGRILRLEFDSFQLVNVYTPNAQRGLTRLPYRMQWEEDFRTWVCALDAQKPVIICGDLNVAHEEIDIKNARANRGNAGFTDEERGMLTRLLDAGFTDSFRYLHPDTEGAYSWWSYLYHARENNAGWRIDYFLVSDRLRDRIAGASIHSDVFGSDHCPVSLELLE